MYAERLAFLESESESLVQARIPQVIDSHDHRRADDVARDLVVPTVGLSIERFFRRAANGCQVGIRPRKAAVASVKSISKFAISDFIDNLTLKLVLSEKNCN